MAAESVTPSQVKMYGGDFALYLRLVLRRSGLYVICDSDGVWLLRVLDLARFRYKGASVH